MTTQAVSIELEPRTVLGKKVKTLRRAGIIPVNIYGAGMESRAMQCEERPLLRALNAAGGEEGQPMRLTVAGESTQFVARAADIQWAPRTGGILHVDFQTVSA
jgi:large subunit ribosomal protein L25